MQRSFEGGRSSLLSLLLLRRLARHHSRGAEQLHVHQLLYTFIRTYIFAIIIIFFLFFVSVLSQPMSSSYIFFLILHPIPLIRCLATCWVKAQHFHIHVSERNKRQYISQVKHIAMKYPYRHSNFYIFVQNVSAF